MTFANATDSPDFVVGPGFGSGILMNQVRNINGLTTFTEIPVYVGNVPELLVLFQVPLNGPTKVTAAWLTGPLITDPVIRRADYYFTSAGVIQDALRCTGPYFTIQIQNLNALNQTTSYVVLPTTGATASVGGTGSGVLAFQTNLIVGAGTTGQRTADLYVPGPAVVSAFGPVGVNFSISGTDQDGNTKIPWFRSVIAGGPTSFNDKISLPRFGWTINAQNTTAGAVGVDTCVTTER